MADKEIHPLTRVSKRNKLKSIIYILLIATFINIGITLYLVLNERGKNKQFDNQNISKKSTEKVNSSYKKYDSKPQKIFFQQIEDLQGSDMKIIEKNINSYKIKDISFLTLSYKNKKLKRNKALKKDFSYYYKLAKIHEKKKSFTNALVFYHKAYKLNPDEDILFKIALLNYKLRAYRGTIKYTKKILNSNPNYIDAYILLAKAYEKLNNSKKAIIVLEEAYYRIGNNRKILRELAKLYEKNNDIYPAIEIYEILANKGNLEDIIKIAKLYEKAGIFDKAILYYKIALKKDKKDKYKQWIQDKIFKLSKMSE